MFSTSPDEEKVLVTNQKNETLYELNLTNIAIRGKNIHNENDIIVKKLTGN